MKHGYILLIATVFSQFSFAQLTSSTMTIQDDLKTINKSFDHKLGKKGAGSKVNCSGDTLDYARYKASQLVGINVSTGYRLGQYFETPGEVTISGFDFYAWQNMRSAAKVTLLCQLYVAGADSLPSGTPVREDSIIVDSTFGAGTLTTIMKRAVFQTPYKTDKPYILVITSSDTNRVAVVTNSYANADGDAEDLGCGTVGGRWYKFKNLNIGGVPLDCDVALEPHVKYTIYNDFSVKDCYNYKDTVKFTNNSSPFFFSKIYNRYKFYNIEQYSHRWDFYGTGGSTYMVEGQVKYANPQNYRIRLISTNYLYRGNNTCIDTTYHDLNFQPDDVIFDGDKSICSGNIATLIAKSYGNVEWFNNISDTASFLKGNVYTTPDTLGADQIIYASSFNKNCQSKMRQQIIEVVKTPSVPTISNDSVCLNSLANLVATSNAGTIRWFADSTTLLPEHAGDVYQVGPLNRDTFFFAKAFNQNCTHNGRVRVTAYVSNAFAPQPPSVSNDTTICLLSGPITLRASSVNTLRWYDVAAGGKVLANGDSTFTFTPTKKGVQNIYVDSYNGNCASSRLPIKITVNHFPTLPGLKNIAGCAGDTLKMDFSSILGDINWYDAKTGGNTVYNGKSRIFEGISKSEDFYLETYQGDCRDSVRYLFQLESIPYGKFISKNLDAVACDGSTPNLDVDVDYGKVVWYDKTQASIIHEGNKLDAGPISENMTYYLNIDNRGCVTKPIRHDVRWAFVPDANYDYQVTWKNVVFASRLISQGYYVWHFGDGSDTSMGTDVKHFYDTDGDYQVSLTVTSIDGCADTINKDVSINTVGIDDKNLSKNINIYPNPVKVGGRLQIGIDSYVEALILFNSSGQKIEDMETILNTENTIAIQLPILPSGVYFIRLQTSKGVYSVPISIID